MLGTIALATAAALTVAAFAAPKRRIETEVFIPAPPAAVWAVLTDGARYGEWNPFIRALSGPIATGARLTTVMHPKGGKPMTFRPRVLSAIPGGELRWLGSLGITRIFDGEHAFRLVPEGSGTRLLHSESFRGLLLWVMKVDRFAEDFARMNTALKARVLALAERP